MKAIAPPLLQGSEACLVGQRLRVDIGDEPRGREVAVSAELGDRRRERRSQLTDS